jgi:hypothetical protein
MSRFVIASLILSAFTSFASAERAPVPDRIDVEAPHFAQPPHAQRVDYLEAYADRAAVRAALARARAANLAAFRAYQAKGVFPSNTYKDGKLNVWRDADGHLCAAATIIDKSGQHDLVRRVAEQSNFIKLADVTQGPLMTWILTSGFTQDEVAAIQEPFFRVGEPAEPRPVIIADRRSAEDQRLRERYTTVTKQLVDSEQKSLDLATDRLMKDPILAATFVKSSASG